jgi:hypothetical protein
MSNKIFVTIEKDISKLSSEGKELYYILKDKNEVFEATVVNDTIHINIDKYKEELDKNIFIINKCWVSSLEATKKRIPYLHTFYIIEDKQLEFNF